MSMFHQETLAIDCLGDFPQTSSSKDENFREITSFWAGLSFLLLFAYRTPEFPTPSFEYHTAFDGVAFGIVTGVQQTYQQFHHEAVPRIFTSQLTIPALLGRMLVGIPSWEEKILTMPCWISW